MTSTKDFIDSLSISTEALPLALDHGVLTTYNPCAWEGTPYACTVARYSHPERVGYYLLDVAVMKNGQTVPRHRLKALRQAVLAHYLAHFKMATVLLMGSGVAYRLTEDKHLEPVDTSLGTRVAKEIAAFFAESNLEIVNNLLETVPLTSLSYKLIDMVLNEQKRQPEYVAVGEVETMPGANGGFTMLVTDGKEVPVGTKLYRAKEAAEAQK